MMKRLILAIAGGLCLFLSSTAAAQSTGAAGALAAEPAEWGALGRMVGKDLVCTCDPERIWLVRWAVPGEALRIVSRNAYGTSVVEFRTGTGNAGTADTYWVEVGEDGRLVPMVEGGKSGGVDLTPAKFGLPWTLQADGAVILDGGTERKPYRSRYRVIGDQVVLESTRAEDWKQLLEMREIGPGDTVARRLATALRQPTGVQVAATDAGVAPVPPDPVDAPTGVATAVPPADPLPDPSTVAAALRRVIEGMRAGQLPVDHVNERMLETQVPPAPATFGAVQAVRFVETAPNRSFKFDVVHALVDVQWQVWLEKSGDRIENISWKLVPRVAARASQIDDGLAIQAGRFDSTSRQAQIILAQTGDAIWGSDKYNVEEYRRNSDGNFYFADTRTNSVHGLKVVDPITVEVFTPGHPQLAPERFVRRYGTGEQHELQYGYFNYLPEKKGVNGLVIRLDGEQLTTATATYASDYRRQPDGSFHYFDANGRATHGLRIVNGRTVDIYELPGGRPSRLIRRGDAPADYIAQARSYSDRMARENDRLMAIREAELAEEEMAWEEEMAYEEAEASHTGANILEGFMRGLSEATATNRAMEQSMEAAAARGLVQGAREYQRRQAAEAYDEGYDDSYEDGYDDGYGATRDQGYDGGYNAGATTQGVTPVTPAAAERVCEVVTKRYSNRSLPKPSRAEAERYLGQLPSLCALGAKPTPGAAECTEDSEPVVTRDEKGIPRTSGHRTMYTCEAVMTCPAAEVCQSEEGGGGSRQ